MSEDTEVTGLAVRRLMRSTNVQLCDLSQPDVVITMGAREWLSFLELVRYDRYRPIRKGEMVTIEIRDRAQGGGLQVLQTTSLNYVEFQRGAAKSRFDGLKPAPLGLGYGPWVTATATIDADVEAARRREAI